MAETQITDDNTLQATVSGGWNTVSSALTLPATDSPEVNNCDTLFSGNVTKRNGLLKVRSDSTANPKNSKAVTVRSKTGRDLIIGKFGTQLRVYDEASPAQPLTKSNVWSSATAAADVLISTEPDIIRAIFFCPRQVPVQLSIREASFTANSVASVFTSIAVPQTDWALQSTTTIIAIIDGVYNALSAFSATSSAVTFTAGTSIADGSHSVILIGCTWQWWAESMRVRTNILVGSVTQGVTQVHVPVPEDMQTDITIVSSGIKRYPIVVLNGTDYDAIYTNTLGVPAVANTYAWSSGIDLANSAGVAKPPLPSPGFITFGAVPANARQVVFARCIRFPFNGGQGITSGAGVENISAWNQFSGQQWRNYKVAPPSEGGAGVGGAALSWHLRRDGSLAVETNGATREVYFCPDATATVNGGIGAVPQDDATLIAWVDDTTLKGRGFLGSAAVGAFAAPIKANQIADGYPWAVHGLSQSCNYNSGSFPTTGCIWQGRLVLSGFTDNPMLVAISAVGDVTTPGYWYTDFQIAYGEGENTDGFDLLIAAEGDESITAVREFQSQLFIWTRNRMFRMTPDSNGLQTNVHTIAEVGCVNKFCVAVTERTVLFLGEAGIFGIEPTDSADGYSLVEVSIKIRNQLSNRPYLKDTAWLAYDRTNLYVGLSNKNVSTFCNELFVYNMLRQAWTKYSDGSGYQIHTTFGFVMYPNTANYPAATVPDTAVLYLIGWSQPSADELAFRRFDSSITFDADLFGTFSGTSATNFVVGFAQQATFTTVADQFEYDPGSSTRNGFRPSSLIDYEDVYVTLNGVPLVFGVDYFKTERRVIRLTFSPLAGNTLVIEPRMRWAGALYPPVAVTINGEYIAPSDYTVNVSGGFWRVRFNAASGYLPNVSDAFKAGTVYPMWHYSPTMTRGMIENAKRLVSYSGYYNNEAGGDYWEASTIPTGRYDLLGTRKKKINTDLVFLFSDTQSGYITTEVFNSSELTWDEAFLGVGTPAAEYQPYIRISVPIVGGGYSFQVVHYCYSPNTIQLSGYQLKAIVKKGRGLHI